VLLSGKEANRVRSYISQAKADQATDFLARWKALVSSEVGSAPDGDRCGV